MTYESIFYRKMKKPRRTGGTTGFTGSRCGRETGATPTSRLQHSADYGVCKQVPSVLHRGTQAVHPVPPAFSDSPVSEGADTNTLVQYLGIAADEPKRLARLDGITKISPLAAIGWTEADCWKWCEENDLLSPIYTTATRGGCWFCHNQSVEQLRLLRKNYPDLWTLLLKWDLDSPVTFHSDGRTVHDFDRRFQMEDEGKIPTDRTFRWKMVDNPDGREETG